MPVVHTSLFCHAPIVIPAVGGTRGDASRATTDAMRALARDVVASRPDVVLVVSPHTPRIEGAVPLVRGTLHVDFGTFGAPLRFELPPIKDTAGLIERAHTHGVRLEPIPMRTLDHGAGVPLAFLHEAGWQGPTAVVGLPYDDDLEVARVLGRIIATWAHGLRVAVVASGDGSHRLKPGAPAGYDPRAHLFDEQVRAHLEAGDDAALARVDTQLRDLAAEDILSSLVVATTAAGHARHRRVMSYEAPFGVGYTVALLDDPPAGLGALPAPPHELTALARASLESHFGLAPPPDPHGVALDAHGLMVSWHTAHDDDLRGCLGHIPKRAPLGQSVVTLAVAAATQDPRFAPVRREELASLRATVTLVDATERVDVSAGLDPLHWGITVRAGHRHGVLLPDLEGVDGVAHQLRITLQKARIDPSEPYELSRFRAVSVTEGRP